VRGDARFRAALYAVESGRGIGSAASIMEGRSSGSKPSRRWTRTKVKFKRSDLVGHRFWKLASHGRSYEILLRADGTLTEHDVDDPSATWTGRWTLAPGVLTIAVGAYRLRVVGSVDGEHSGLEIGPGSTHFFLVVPQSLTMFGYRSRMERIVSHGRFLPDVPALSRGVQIAIAVAAVAALLLPLAGLVWWVSGYDFSLRGVVDVAIGAVIIFVTTLGIWFLSEVGSSVRNARGGERACWIAFWAALLTGALLLRSVSVAGWVTVGVVIVVPSLAIVGVRLVPSDDPEDYLP
jgi:hypothetical protein